MPEIRLDKKTKTIKIVNRRDNIRLKHDRDVVNLKHTGKTGPQGPQGPTGVSTFVRVHHGTDPNVERPVAVFVEWVGSVVPLNATDEDTWIDTA